MFMNRDDVGGRHGRPQTGPGHGGGGYGGVSRDDDRLRAPHTSSGATFGGDFGGDGRGRAMQERRLREIEKQRNRRANAGGMMSSGFRSGGGLIGQNTPGIRQVRMIVSTRSDSA